MGSPIENSPCLFEKIWVCKSKNYNKQHRRDMQPKETSPAIGFLSVSNQPTAPFTWEYLSRKVSMDLLTLKVCNTPVTYLRKIIPIRDIVAGEAQLRSWVSNIKLTFEPNWILSPLGIVNNLLSSKTEFKDSIHSGSISPSQIIHEVISISRHKNKISNPRQAV